MYAFSCAPRASWTAYDLPACIGAQYARASIWCLHTGSTCFDSRSGTRLCAPMIGRHQGGSSLEAPFTDAPRPSTEVKTTVQLHYLHSLLLLLGSWAYSILVYRFANPESLIR